MAGLAALMASRRKSIGNLYRLLLHTCSTVNRKQNVGLHDPADSLLFRIRDSVGSLSKPRTFPWSRDLSHTDKGNVNEGPPAVVELLPSWIRWHTPLSSDSHGLPAGGKIRPDEQAPELTCGTGGGDLRQPEVGTTPPPAGALGDSQLLAHA